MTVGAFVKGQIQGHSSDALIHMYLKQEYS